MNKSGRPRKNEAGFTLLEIVIAVTLIAMMAVALWSVLRISISAWKRGTEFIDANQRNRSILDMVKKQMASIYGLTAPVDLQNPGIYPIFAGAEGSVQFISLNSLRFMDNPGLTLVSYDVARDRGGNFSLVEREIQYLGMDPSRESLFDRREETVVTIFQDLTSFSFEYFDPGTADRPARWVKSWDARETQRLPTAISMTMSLHDSSGTLFSRHMVVPILAKPYDPQLPFVNPFITRQRRLGDDDSR